MPQRFEAVVCGAGGSGLGAAAMLRRRGVKVVVLEQADQIASSWRARYDDLQLNTVGWMSSAPGTRAWGRRYGRYPHRDRWVEYLEHYADRNRLEVRGGVTVERIDPVTDGWRIATSQGPMETPLAVVATGWDREPYIPDWHGREDFAGELIHASAYRSAARFRDRDVLVVGAAATGSEIAYFLVKSGAARVRVAVRTVPNIAPRDLLRFPLNYATIVGERLPLRLADRLARGLQRLVFGDLTPHGLPAPPLGMFSSLALRGVSPVVDCGFVREVKRGRIELVHAVERFDRTHVVLSNGARIEPDVVIAATGYRRGLEPLVGHLGILDDRGAPLVSGGREHPSAPGLYFVGYTLKLSGQLRQARLEARSLGRAVDRRRRSPRPRPTRSPRHTAGDVVLDR